MIQRLAFRFFVVYLALYCLATQILGGLILFPNFQFPAFGTIWPMRDVTLWLATRVFHVNSLVYAGTSGDTAFHWVQTFWLLIAAAIIAAISVRLKPDATAVAVVASDFSRTFFRFALAGQMFYYGMAKVIPTQFPPPSLVTLVNPVGNLSPADLLWTFIGASTPYQMFTGWAEVVAGVLLVVPRTATLGALIAFADMVQVLALNSSYDFGLKQVAFHLILISLFLLAPDARRLAAAIAPAQPRANKRALALQLAFGVYLLAMFTRLALISWSGPGGPGSPRSPLYGIWDVARLSVDGEARPPQQNDYDRRWRRVIFDADGMMIFQRLDDSFAHYGASVDTPQHLIVLTKGSSRTWKTTFVYDRQEGGDDMTLDGTMDGHVVHADLKRVGFDTFKLLSNPFRWVRPARD